MAEQPEGEVTSYSSYSSCTSYYSCTSYTRYTSTDLPFCAASFLASPSATSAEASRARRSASKVSSWSLVAGCQRARALKIAE